ncbi:MAG: ribonuclease P protein component [Pseudomonadales bacterium]
MSETLESFPSRARLTKPSEFDRAFKAAEKRLRSGPLRVLVIRNDADCPRLGLVVGKRHLKRAVDRNRIKRVVREAFRKHRSSLPSIDVVVQLAAAANVHQVMDAFGAVLTQLSQRIAPS